MRMKHRLAQALSLVCIVAVWSVASVWVGTDIIPPPWRVASTCFDLIQTGTFAGPLLQSLGRVGFAFFIAVLAAISYGIAAARVPTFGRATHSLFRIALFAPTLVIIFVTVAIVGGASVWLAIAIISFITIAPNLAVYVRDVMTDVDDEVLSMAAAYKATTFRRVLDIYLPHLTPALLTVARVGFNSSWKVIMLTEVFGMPGGLGYQIRTGYTAYNMRELLAWLVIFVIVLLVVEQFIRGAESMVVKWR